jgi:hypothetical protein
MEETSILPDQNVQIISHKLRTMNQPNPKLNPISVFGSLYTYLNHGF